MEGAVQNQAVQQVLQQQNQPVLPVERLNLAVQQQLNLEAVKTRAVNLFNALSRILEEFDAYARTNTNPKWQDVLSQYSMVNLELFNIVDEIKKVSKAFVVHPKNVNAENSTSMYSYAGNVLPVMLSSKLLPEMEVEDNSKREQLMQGLQSMPLPTQIEKLKMRIDMIGAACESAEKVLADTRKAYCFGTRQGPQIAPTLDKAQAAKIQEQENLLRAAVNYGEGLRIPGDQRQISPALPIHLVDVLNTSDGVQSLTDTTGIYMKNTHLASNNMNAQGAILQAPGSQLIGRSANSPSNATSATSFENNTTSPLPYANSPRSSTNMMNTPSPQQQTQQQQQHQQQQQQIMQQRQKMMQLPQHQQLLAQQQFRQSAMQGLGQNQMNQLHDLQSQTQQKFQSIHGQHQMQLSQSMGNQQFQGRQLSSGHIQHGIGQSQFNQGNQMNRHLSQFTATANNALFNPNQTTQNSQMIPNVSATMTTQPPMSRMQFGLPGSNSQRTHASQILTDQMFNMGGVNPGGMMAVQQPQQQQQHGTQGTFGNLPTNAQTLQSGMVTLQNLPQGHPNFGQQRQQNQQ